jgi:eukaryotic-like serine/threonine-protein kinase
MLEPLGRGAMSSVWLAEDEELGRRVAVKTLVPSADTARFAREARAAAALSDPNICSLYDYGDSDGKPFMVLEYLPNGSLEERLADGRPLDDGEALRISTEIAAGLAHAHGRGLVHRDLKPANVLFDAEDRAKIADFGIARMGGQGTLTEAGTVLGTASYISPEQAAGLPAGPASDVYSFGVILFRMLTGRLPFVSTNAMELVRMHRDDLPPRVGEFRADGPAGLEAVTAAALAKHPADRPADGAALLRELVGDATAATIVGAPGAFAVVSPSSATQVLGPPARVRARRVPLAVVAAAVPALLAAGVAVALIAANGGDTAPSPTLPGLRLPTVPAAGSTSTTAGRTTARTSAPTTTARAGTTAATATAPTTSAPTTPSPPATTVAPTTTAPVTSDTTPTTTTTATTATTTTTPTTTTTTTPLPTTTA